MGCKIERIEYHLPVRILGNEELAEGFEDWKPKKIERKTGIRERRIVADGETSLDLAAAAAEKILDGMDRAEVDFLLVCTQTPDHILPPNACILQDRLGLSTEVGALDFSLGCSGYVYGLSIAKGLIETGVASKILLITSETYSKLIHPDDRANRTIFGDGAAATLVSSTDADQLGSFVLGTDGSGAEHLIVTNGAFRHPTDPEADDDSVGGGGKSSKNHLHMNGPEIFNFMIDRVPSLVNDTLNRNGLKLEELDYVVLHQANRYMLEYVRTKIDVPEEKFHNDLLTTGNTVSATIPIALKDAFDDRRIATGDKVLLVGFGLGLSWGATIIRL
jgi:3-oxoacyl-[acyl-carrier-protein] synthase-3